ncbi:MAG TPA: tRNA lysidine(34) synthetase TilS, partial [Bryobacteraceae bacterium]
MTSLVERVAAAIGRYGMLASGARVGVAVSGGPDSVCLLHVLLELAPRMDLHLSVLHLDHQLRGEDSRRDAVFVRDLAAERGLVCHLREVNVADIPGNLEQAARRARLEFFREMIESGAVDRVAVGHTRSDQAETVLFRFLRGSGTAGLAGIRPVIAPGIVRPLLEVDRAAVEQFLRERGIGWREDSTNAGFEFARNRIRHGLLPQLAREWNPAIVETLSQTADWARAEESYWDCELARLAATHLVAAGGAVIVRVDALTALPVAVARRLVRHAVRSVRGDLRRIDFGHIAAILELAARGEGHGRAAVPGLDVCRSFEWVRIAPGGVSLPHQTGFGLPAP